MSHCSSRRRLFGGAIFCTIMALFLVGCNPPVEDPILRFGLARAPVTLDPRFATDATSARLNRLLYRQLVDFDKRAMPVPALATWQRLTATHYRFQLGQQGRHFHDGSRLQAVDVKATYDYVLNQANGSPHRAAIALIHHIETPDQDTVDFLLSKPDPLFPGYLVVGILPATAIKKAHPFETAPIGSGPFRLGEWVGEQRITLIRIQDNQPFEFLPVRDPTVRALKLLRGEIDMMQNDLLPELVGYLQKDKAIQVQQAKGTSYTYLGFNLQDKDTGRKKVRQAIACGIDRQAIIHYLLHDAARLAQGMFPPEHWAAAELSEIFYNPTRAKALLKKAGYHAAQPLRLVFKTSTNPKSVRIATLIQSQLKEVGILVEIRSHDWGTFYGDVKAGRFQLFSLTWVGIKSPDIYHYVFHSNSIPPKGANRGRFTDSKVDQLIEQAAKAEESGVQARLYRTLAKQLLEKLPYVPLWYEDQVFVSRLNIKGYQISPDGNYDSLSLVYRQRMGTK